MEEKLEQAFSEPITKANVVYILSLVRKIIDKSRTKDKYPVLYFFCLWVLHPQIDRSVNQIQDAYNWIHQIKDIQENAETRLIFQKFNQQLSKFKRSYDLPETNNVALFQKEFNSLLLEIISDSPLIFKRTQEKITLVTIENKVGEKVPYFKIEKI